MSVSSVIIDEAVIAFQSMKSDGLELSTSAFFSRDRIDAPMISQQFDVSPRSFYTDQHFSGSHRLRSAHLVGICGAGMKALAELLMGLGCRVTGSDLQTDSPTVEKFRNRGFRIHTGHHGSHLNRDVDVLVYSSAIGSNNPERRMASRFGIPQCSYSEMLGELMRTRVGVSIAGTHGKSTTTAMTASILETAGLSPSAIVGAELCNRRVNGWAGEGELIVVESCEYRKNFLDCSPKYGVILNVEPDHFDCFQHFEETEAAFAEYAAGVDVDGVLLVRGDCSSAVNSARAAEARVATFSCDNSQDVDWWASDFRQTRFGTRFRIFHQGIFFTEILLSIPGRHNILNALAASAISHYAGASTASIRDALYEFRGIRRRFEWLGSWRGTTLIDDFAHHPTEIRETLKTARKQFQNRRIWTAFQPHQISRTEMLLDEFSSSFEDADQVIIVPIYAARESGGQAESTLAEELVTRVSRQRSHVRFVGSLDRLMTTLEDETRPGDVIITMGAGDIDRVPYEFTRRLQRNHPEE